MRWYEQSRGDWRRGSRLRYACNGGSGRHPDAWRRRVCRFVRVPGARWVQGGGSSLCAGLVQSVGAGVCEQGSRGSRSRVLGRCRDGVGARLVYGSEAGAGWDAGGGRCTGAVGRGRAQAGAGLPRIRQAGTQTGRRAQRTSIACAGGCVFWSSSCWHQRGQQRAVRIGVGGRVQESGSAEKYLAASKQAHNRGSDGWS